MYKNWYINALEMLTYFNIVAVSIITLYSLDSTNTNQRAVTNVSVAIIFAQLLVVIIYHTFKYTMLSKVWKTKIYQNLWTKFRAVKQKRCRFGHHEPPSVHTNIQQFSDRELLDMIDQPVNTNDYNIPQVRPEPAEPTQSVIELPKPCLAPQASMEKETKVQEWKLGPCQQLMDLDPDNNC